MNHSLRLLIAVIALLFGSSAIIAQQVAEPPVAADPSSATLGAKVSAWVASLKEEQRTKAVFSFETEERENWHFVPKVRVGLPLKEMTEAQREAAMDMLKATLSDDGLKQTKEIMKLESVLAAKENRPDFRDPTKYYVAIFGDAASSEPWGWRFEGHHVSLNFSTLSGATISTTPAFYGSSPATVMEGPHKGLRPLGREEDLGRKLVKSLSESQQAKAVISDTAPEELVTGTARVAELESRDGLPIKELTEDQRSIVQELIGVYVGRYTAERAKQLHAKLESEKDDEMVFAWAGSMELGQPHYYRIVGKTLLIEYDNTQNEANHAHSVLRFFDNDFGRDVLKEHYEHGHKHE